APRTLEDAVLSSVGGAVFARQGRLVAVASAALVLGLALVPEGSRASGGTHHITTCEFAELKKAAEEGGTALYETTCVGFLGTPTVNFGEQLTIASGKELTIEVSSGHAVVLNGRTGGSSGVRLFTVAGKLTITSAEPGSVSLNGYLVAANGKEVSAGVTGTPG